jgi:hypothetical protein
MNREPWVAYLIVLVVVGAMMYGKYLMASGDDKPKDEEKKD